jgi:large repetitive protein
LWLPVLSKLLHRWAQWFEYSIDGTAFQASALFENLVPATYTVTVRNSEGCISSASAVIEVAPLAPETPVLATVDPTCIVATGSIEVTSPVGSGYEYSINGTAIPGFGSV